MREKNSLGRDGQGRQRKDPSAGKSEKKVCHGNARLRTKKSSRATR